MPKLCIPFPYSSIVVAEVLLLVVGSLNAYALIQQDPLELHGLHDSTTTYCNCSTTETPLTFYPLSGNEPKARLDNDEGTASVVSVVDIAGDDRNTNISHLKTFSMPKDWDAVKPTLNFPKTSSDERYKMASLHLDKGIFAFDFLQSFLYAIQPHDVPIGKLKNLWWIDLGYFYVISMSRAKCISDLMKDVVENRITAFKLISEVKPKPSSYTHA